MTREQKVLKFIKRRFKNDSNWTSGNCYYFALILCERFSDLVLFYEPIEGHFLAGNETTNEYYDWTGKVIPSHPLIGLMELRQQDPLWYSHLMRDCKN